MFSASARLIILVAAITLSGCGGVSGDAALTNAVGQAVANAPTTPATTPVQTVPCLSLAQITYAAPKDPNQVILWLQNRLPAAPGKYDTPDTVAQIRRQNAAIAAVCGGGK